MLLSLMVLLVLLPSSTHAETGAGRSSVRFDCALLPLPLQAELSSIPGSDDSTAGACGIRFLLLLLLTDFRWRSGGRHGLAGRHPRRGAGFFANAKVIDGCSSVGWMAGTTLFQLLLRLLRAASASVCGDGCSDYGGRTSGLLELAGPSADDNDDRGNTGVVRMAGGA